MDDLAHLLALVIGYLIAQVARYIARNRFWSKVAKDAERQLEDPDVPVNDPGEATANALIAAHSGSMARVIQTVRAKRDSAEQEPVEKRNGDHV